MTNEAPGGTVGCDVCGIEVSSDRSSAHRDWHRTEREWIDRVADALRELADALQGDSSQRGR